MLMIIDGFGINENEQGNAVKLANTPNLDRLMKTCPNSRIFPSGLRCRTSKRSNGKFRSRTHKHRCWKNCIPRANKITKSIEDGDFFLAFQNLIKQ